MIVVAGSVLGFSGLVDEFPDRVPLPWNAVGDRYGSSGELWSLLPAMLLMVALSWGGAWGLAHQRLALDPERAEERLRLEIRYRRFLVRLFEVVALGLAFGIGSLWVALAWSAGSGEDAPASAIVVPVVFLILFGLVVLIGFFPRIQDVRAAIADLAGPTPLGTRPDGWKLHGLIYFAPSDPALLVPMMRGLGITWTSATGGRD